MPQSKQTPKETPSPEFLYLIDLCLFHHEKTPEPFHKWLLYDMLQGKNTSLHSSMADDYNLRDDVEKSDVADNDKGQEHFLRQTSSSVSAGEKLRD